MRTFYISISAGKINYLVGLLVLQNSETSTQQQQRTNDPHNSIPPHSNISPTTTAPSPPPIPNQMSTSFYDIPSSVQQYVQDHPVEKLQHDHNNNTNTHKLTQELDARLTMVEGTLEQLNESIHDAESSSVSSKNEVHAFRTQLATVVEDHAESTSAVLSDCTCLEERVTLIEEKQQQLETSMLQQLSSQLQALDEQHRADVTTLNKKITVLVQVIDEFQKENDTRDEKREEQHNESMQRLEEETDARVTDIWRHISRKEGRNKVRKQPRLPSFLISSKSRKTSTMNNVNNNKNNNNVGAGAGAGDSRSGEWSDDGKNSVLATAAQVYLDVEKMPEPVLVRNSGNQVLLRNKMGA